jgi:spore photoproduct lyase
LSFDHVLIEDDVAESILALRVKEALPHATSAHVSKEQIRELIRTGQPDVRSTTLLLARQRGAFVKLCPGYQGANCCAYFILHTINDCPFSCSYCALGAVINAPFITVYANLDDCAAELEKQVFALHSRIRRIGTGQFSDSLELDQLTGISPFLVELFGRHEKAYLELKSKSKMVGHLLDLDHRKQTIISFSLSLPEVIEREEGGTASLDERLAAAVEAQTAGYRVGLHFDPLVEVDSWAKKYRDAVEMIGDLLDPRSIVWVSLGTLRLDRSLRYSMRESNPNTRLDLAELIRGYDGRYRYLPVVRARMYGVLSTYLRKLDLPVYLCMEAPRYWQAALGWKPRSPLDVKGFLDDLAINRWPTATAKRSHRRRTPNIERPTSK